MPTDVQVSTNKAGQHIAVWHVKGKKRTAPLSDDGTRIILETAVWYAEYRDGRGKLKRQSTGFTDKMVATDFLREREREAERERQGIVTPAERTTANHSDAPIADHITAFVAYLTTNGRATGYVKNAERQLTRIVNECGAKRLAELDRHTFEQWLTGLGVANSTRNSYRAIANSFLNWCADPAIGRIGSNPFKASLCT